MKYAYAAWLGSLFLMLGAFFFQYGMDMRPCQLCYYQRIPHSVVIVMGALAIWKNWRNVFPFLGALILMGAGIAFFHAGVEQHWWEGLQSCSGSANISFDDLMATAPAACDEIPWQFLGLSMAAWNGIFSLFIGILWFMAWKRS